MTTHILALTCSTQYASVAYLHQGYINSTQNYQAHQHSEIILTLIEQSLNGHPIDKIDCIAVDIGPGSFMGIRTAIATAQGLALAHSIPIYSINSLHLLALSVIAKKHHTPDTQSILTALDARRQEWYFAHWKITTPPTSTLPLAKDRVHIAQKIIVSPPTECLAILPPEILQNAILAGDTWQEHLTHTSLPSSTTIQDKHIQHPNASILAQIAQDNPTHWHHSDQLTPLYIRDNVAYPTTNSTP